MKNNTWYRKPRLIAIFGHKAVHFKRNPTLYRAVAKEVLSTRRSGAVQGWTINHCLRQTYIYAEYRCTHRNALHITRKQRNRWWFGCLRSTSSHDYPNASQPNQTRVVSMQWASMSPWFLNNAGLLSWLLYSRYSILYNISPPTTTTTLSRHNTTTRHNSRTNH